MTLTLMKHNGRMGLGIRELETHIVRALSITTAVTRFINAREPMAMNKRKNNALNNEK